MGASPEGSWETTRSIGRECTAGDRRSRPVLTAKRLDHPDPPASRDGVGVRKPPGSVAITIRDASGLRLSATTTGRGPRSGFACVTDRPPSGDETTRRGRRGLTARRPTPRRRDWRGHTRSHPEHGR